MDCVLLSRELHLLTILTFNTDPTMTSSNPNPLLLSFNGQLVTPSNFLILASAGSLVEQSELAPPHSLWWGLRLVCAKVEQSEVVGQRLPFSNEISTNSNR